jgi:hypothetical protein
MSLDWEKIGELSFNKHLLEIHKTKTKNTHIMGVWGHEDKEDGEIKEVFVVITEVTTLPRGDIKHYFKYNTPIQMTSLSTKEGFKDQGYATLLYKWFYNKGILLFLI